MANELTKLGRPATGLARYYMDCGWYRHPRFVGLPPETLFVFEAAVGYCHEHESNGDVPSNVEDLAMALGVRTATVRKAIPALLDRHAIEDCGELLHIRGYEDHNPTAEEIQARMKERSTAGSLGNHIRWHKNKGVVDIECAFCMEEGSHADATF